MGVMEMTGRIENRKTREDRLERLVESLSGNLGMLEGTVNHTVEMSREDAVSRTLVRTQLHENRSFHSKKNYIIFLGQK